MKGSRLNSWSKKQLTHSDHSEHLFKPLFLKKKKEKRYHLFYVETTVSRNETLVLSEEKNKAL